MLPFFCASYKDGKILENRALIYCSEMGVHSTMLVYLLREMMTHRKDERQALEKALKAEGANAELAASVRYGIAFHHAGLASDERAMIEQAYR